jgi:hypothetical protein
MDDIVELSAILRNSVSRETMTYVEASGRLYSQKRQACLRGAVGFFRVRHLPLARRGLDSLPAEKASIDRP